MIAAKLLMKLAERFLCQRFQLLLYGKVTLQEKGKSMYSGGITTNTIIRLVFRLINSLRRVVGALETMQSCISRARVHFVIECSKRMFGLRGVFKDII
jgi:hypothetical protein